MAGIKPSRRAALGLGGAALVGAAAVGVMAAEVNFLDAVEWKPVEIVQRRRAMVGGRNEDVVDVEQVRLRADEGHQ